MRSYDDSISCELVLGKLGDFLSGDLDEVEARQCRRHLESCRDCARYRSDYERTIELVREIRDDDDPEPPPSPGDGSAALPEHLVAGILRSRKHS